MIVTTNRSVVFLDHVSIQRLGILLHPRLEFGIGRLVLLDVISHRLLFEAKRRERHRIETFANARIAGSKFTALLQRDLLPKTREMYNAKWPGNAGANQWNVCVAHNYVIVTLNNQPSTLNLFDSPVTRRQFNSTSLRFYYHRRPDVGDCRKLAAV